MYFFVTTPGISLPLLSPHDMIPNIFGWSSNAIPPGGDGAIPPWSELKFNPLGIYNLRRRIGLLSCEPGIFTHYQHRFEAADVAWFAAGTSEDGNHYVHPDLFHEAFNIVRSDLPTGEEGSKWRKALRARLQKILFDIVSLLSKSRSSFFYPTQGNVMGSCVRQLNNDSSC